MGPLKLEGEDIIPLPLPKISPQACRHILGVNLGGTGIGQKMQVMLGGHERWDYHPKGLEPKGLELPIWVSCPDRQKRVYSPGGQRFCSALPF